MKLAVSQIAWREEDDEEALKMLEAAGFSGLEIAPTRVAGPQPYEYPEAAAAYAAQMWANHNLTLCSMQSIWYGQAGNMFLAEGAYLLGYTKQAIRFAKAGGIPNIVFGCPKNRTLPEGATDEEAARIFCEMGDCAAQNGTCLALEANPAMYGTNLMNHTADALAMAKRVNSPGCRVNLDFGTMLANGEEPAQLVGHVKEINHVHISEPNLLPIEPRPGHKTLAAILRNEGYEGFVSIEMREQPLAVLGDVLQYGKEVFG